MIASGPARGGVRLRLLGVARERVDRAIDPDPHTITGVPRRKAEPAASYAQPAGELERDELIMAVEGPLDDASLRPLGRGRVQSDRHRLRAHNDIDGSLEVVLDV